jgi:hypothetical protein
MARKYKMPEELGLTLQQYGALLGTKELLERKVLTHTLTPEQAVNKGVGITTGFNMAVWQEKSCALNKECDTVSCIGGTMDLLMGNNESDCQPESKIFRLFFPPVNNM